MRTTKISAHVSEEAKVRLDRFVRQAGMTRGRVIEEALLHHLLALEELPAAAIVPGRVVLSQDSAADVRELISRPPSPTEEMKRLFDDR